jgi:hypothetical protein
MNADAASSPSGAVSFTNSDADEGTFDFTVRGQVVAATVSRVIDNDSPGFAKQGEWVSRQDAPGTTASGGYDQDYFYSTKGNGSDTATWTFDNITPGVYRVSSTWWPMTGYRATNAPFTILDGTVAVGTVTANQEQLPNDFQDGGVSWESLGNFAIGGNTLVVRLSDAANNYVIADAVRIERIGDLPPPPAIQIIDNDTTGFSRQGEWVAPRDATGPGGYDRDYDYSVKGSGADTASWNFTNLTPGTYRVSTTWWPMTGYRATDAPFTVYDDTTALGTKRLNQEVLPNDFAENGVLWQDIGTFTIAGNSLKVQLSDAANSYVIADAVRIERIS